MDMVNGAAALTLMVMVNMIDFNQMRPLTIPMPIENSVYRSTAAALPGLPPRRGLFAVFMKSLGTLAGREAL